MSTVENVEKNFKTKQKLLILLIVVLCLATAGIVNAQMGGVGGGGGVPVPISPEEKAALEKIIISEKEVAPVGGGAVTPIAITKVVAPKLTLAFMPILIIFIIFLLLCIVAISLATRKKPTVGKKMKICPKCQRTFEERLNFCTQCGTKLREYVEAKRGIPLGKIIIILIVLGILFVLFILFFMSSRMVTVQKLPKVSEIGGQKEMSTFCNPCFKYFTFVEGAGDVIVLRNGYPDKITIIDVASDVSALEFARTSLAPGEVVKIAGMPQKKDVAIWIKYEIMSTGVLDVDTAVMHQKS